MGWDGMGWDGVLNNLELTIYGILMLNDERGGGGGGGYIRSCCLNSFLLCYIHYFVDI